MSGAATAPGLIIGTDPRAEDIRRLDDQLFAFHIQATGIAENFGLRIKQVGDVIEQDESVLEVATDKVDTEVPAIYAGVLTEILVQEGQVVAVGAPIAVMETDTATAGAAAPASAPAAPQAAPAPSSNGSAVPYLPEPHDPQAAQMAGAVHQPGRFLSPLVLSIAREEGVSMSDLDYLPGTGKERSTTVAPPGATLIVCTPVSGLLRLPPE